MQHATEDEGGGQVKGEDQGMTKRYKSGAGGEEGAGAGHKDTNAPPSNSGDTEASEDGGSAVSERGGNEDRFEACHEVLAKFELLQVVMEYVGDGHFLFMAGTSKEWRARYGHFYPALKTNLSSVVRSVESMRWATSRGLALTVKVFGAAARHGDVEVCKALHGKACPWREWVCRATVLNKQYGLSILQWLRSEHLPGKERCPMNGHVCGAAGYEGNLEMVKWLLSEEGNAPFSSSSWNSACQGGHAPVVVYLLSEPGTRALLDENLGGEWRSGAACAAMKGHLGVLQLLHAKARHLCDWDARVCRNAVMRANSLAVLQWLRSEEVQCAWDEMSCPQVLRDKEVYEEHFGRKWDISGQTFGEIKRWVHANGHPCDCED